MCGVDVTALHVMGYFLPICASFLEIRTGWRVHGVDVKKVFTPQMDKSLGHKGGLDLSQASPRNMNNTSLVVLYIP